MTSTTNPRFVPLDQACRILGISRPTLFRRLKDGSIPCIRLGARRMVPVAFVEALEAAALTVAADKLVGSDQAAR